MINLPLLAAPLAFAFLACVPSQAATADKCRLKPTSAVVATGFTINEFVAKCGSALASNDARQNSTPFHETDGATPTFDVIPEPTAAALGLVGMFLLLCHRRN